MIVELTVENLAIIEHTRLELGAGFTVLTGETGAGKSLLIDAIELALGERADTELVRAGALRATVSVVIDLTSRPEAVERCEELGIHLEGSMLHIQREVLAEGRSTCRIEGKLTPVNTLKQLGESLVDLHGQHDHQSLLEQERHLGFLDDWIGGSAHAARSIVAKTFGEVEEIQRRLKALQTGVRDREHRLDLLRFQIQEIESIEPLPGEMDELESQLLRLKNSEKIANASMGALETSADQEGSAMERLGEAVRSLEDVLRFDPGFEPVLAPWREALYNLEEGIQALRGYVDRLDSDPESLEEVASRIDALRRLRRKYGEDEAAVLAFLDEARRELEELTESEFSESELSNALDAARTRWDAAARELTHIRTSKAPEFSALVQHQLRDLGMDRAMFSVDIQEQPCSETGADRIEFYFSANVGEPLRPLAKIASGGEISRVMLAIKTALAGRAGVPTLIFDEVDAGLGGRAAATVARKLAELAETYQVLVISHLPQIASKAKTHFRIEKVAQDERVHTQLRRLSSQERIEEIARMLAGDAVTEGARSNASEMLSDVIRA